MKAKTSKARWSLGEAVERLEKVISLEDRVRAIELEQLSHGILEVCDLLEVRVDVEAAEHRLVDRYALRRHHNFDLLVFRDNSAFLPHIENLRLDELDAFWKWRRRSLRRHRGGQRLSRWFERHRCTLEC